MKKIITGFLTILALGITAQNVPQGINYQAVARDNTGAEITSTGITVRYSIGSSTVNNTTYNYQETHNVSTNQFGLFNTIIGQGTPGGTSGAFAAIGWNTPQYLLVEIDFGSGYEQMGNATPFVTVPYSFLAKDVINKELPITATNNDILAWDGTNWIATSPGSVSETTTTITDNSDGTFTYQNELGSSVTFDANIDDADASVTNEIQDLSLSGNTLTITNNGAATPIDLSIYNELPTPSAAGQVVIWNGTAWTAVAPSDPSPTNEIQDVTVVGNDINISSGTGSTISSIAPTTAGQVLTWTGTAWEAQNSGSGADNWGSQVVVSDATITGDGSAGSPLSGFDGDYGNLTSTPAIPANTSDLTNDSGFLTTEIDGSTTNEIQDVTVTGNAINITSGTGTTISTNAPVNGQVLTWNNTAGAWEAQNPGSGADNWGSQVVVSDATISGDGSAGSPLSGFDGDYGSLTNTPSIPTDTDNQTIDVFQLNSNSLELSLEDDGVATQSVDLSSIADQTVSLTGGTGITVAGTYPNFTLTNSAAGDTDWIQGTGVTYNTTDNIGIGTSTPSQLLHIENNTSPIVFVRETTPTSGAVLILESQNQWMLHSNESGDFKVTDNTTSEERISIDGATGNVGISNSLPSSRLDIVSNSFNLLNLETTGVNSNVNVGISPTGAGSAQFRISNGTGGYLFYTTNGGINPVIKATDNNRVGIDLNGTPLSSLDVNGQITMRNGAIVGYIPVSDINGTMTWTDPTSLNDGDWIKSGLNTYNLTDNIGIGVSGAPAKLSIQGSGISSATAALNIDNAGGSTLVRVRDDGSVGIGTTTPNQKLSVSEGNIGIFRSDGQDPLIYFSGDANGIGWSVGVEDSDAGYFKIAANSSLTPNTRLTITDGGNVGIGATDPQFKFQVEDGVTRRAGYFNNTFSTANVINNELMGVYGGAHGTGASDKIGGYFETSSGSGVNYGVYANSFGGSTNWAGYFNSGNVYIQNQLGVGSLTPYYPLHVEQNVSDLTGTDGAFMAIQNSNSAGGTGQLAGIRFRTDGVNSGNSRFKGGLYFEKTGSWGVGDMIFALNTDGNNNNATTADQLMRLSRDPSTDGLGLSTVTSGDAGSFNNATLVGGTGVRATATLTATGVGNRYGVYSTAWYGQSINYGVYAYGYGGTTSYGIYANAGGASTTNYAGYFSGNVNVTGTLSKGGGTFKIDHPQDPENKYLYHSFVESPDMMNIYNGNVVTDADGFATIELPEYFESLNKEFRYQLTVIGSFSQAIVYKEVSNNTFTIQTNDPDVKVSWQVTGIRKDAWAEENRVIPEVDKKGDEKGKYIHPALFGQPAEKGIDYENSKRNTEQNQ